jgi:hypothetical protein
MGKEYSTTLNVHISQHLATRDAAKNLPKLRTMILYTYPSATTKNNGPYTTIVICLGRSTREWKPDDDGDLLLK